MNTASPLFQLFDSFNISHVSEERKTELQPIIDYLQQKLTKSQSINLVYVCTHNSRRSQFAQVWSEVASEFYKLSVTSYSSGTEVTEANPRTITALKNQGFSIEKQGEKNPVYRVSTLKKKIELFSKDLTHKSLPSKFIALMTCSHADENCPFIPEAETRIPFRFLDPKEFDNSEFETQQYLEKSVEIGTEIKYIFHQLTH